jgi:5-methylcytosine-specific restriction endonuclease McrA
LARLLAWLDAPGSNSPPERRQAKGTATPLFASAVAAKAAHKADSRAERRKELFVARRKTPHGRQKHQLQQSKRRAVMRGNAATLTAEEWRLVLDVYEGRCAYCRCGGPMTIDHLVPVMAGGEHVRGNVVPACLSCNSKKNDAALDVALLRLGVDEGSWWAARKRALHALG